MKLGPENQFHSRDDADKYYKIVYYIVNLNKFVPVQDKLDVAHEAIKRLIQYDKTINVRYISKTTKSVIYNYIRGKIRTGKIKSEMYKINQSYGSHTFEGFESFDLNELPISKEELEQLIEYVEESNADLCEKYGLKKSTVAMRKTRLIEKIRERLDE